MIGRRAHTARATFAAACVLLLAACSRPAPRFAVDNARAHVRVLAETIGSRPVGSDANRRARDYIVEQLRGSGFTVRLQETDAERRGTTAHVVNVIGTRPGLRGQAIALVTHYDSVADGPGAADDGLGVAVCLEAGRVLATMKRPRYALAVVFTDGEETGLMGATALAKDPIMGWIRAVLNFEAVGSGGPNVLFQTAPGSRLVLDAWSQNASRPAGGSYMSDIYERLPNDTDFTVFRRARVPGINFAAVGDGYSYHTDRDTAARLDPELLHRAGETAVRTVEALDSAEDLSDRSGGRIVYFDLLGARAVTYGTRTALILFAAALLAALFGWLTVLSAARRAAGWAHLLLTLVWAIVGGAVVAAAMVGGTWLLRETRETYQPWYAHPDRLFVYLVLVAVAAGWLVLRVGRFLPARARGSTAPAVAWAIILPVWAALAVVAQVVAPSAAYLAVIPLLTSGVALAVCPVRHAAALRVVSAVVLVVAWVLWANCLMLLPFTVTTFGRLPIVTPLYVYPALLLLLGLFLAAPWLPLMTGWRDALARRRYGRLYAAVVGSPGLASFALVVFGAAWCWFAPAYTGDRPMHASIAYVNDLNAATARWQLTSNEPAAPVGVSAPLVGSWQSGLPPSRLGVALPLQAWAFPFYGVARDRQTPPVRVSASLRREADGGVVEIAAVPQRPAVTVVFRLPLDGPVEETNLPGTERDGEGFAATYVAVPPGGVTLRARIGSSDAAKLESGLPGTAPSLVAVTSGLPGADWPALPGWLPRDRVAWHARSYYIIPVPLTMAKPAQSGSERRQGPNT